MKDIHIGTLITLFLFESELIMHCFPFSTMFCALHGLLSTKQTLEGQAAGRRRPDSAEQIQAMWLSVQPPIETIRILELTPSHSLLWNWLCLVDWWMYNE